MAIPSEEQLELDLQELANYQRFKRFGDFPEIYFVIGVSGAGGSSSGGSSAVADAILAEIRDRLGASTGAEIALPASLSVDGRMKTQTQIRKLTVEDDKVGVKVESSILPPDAATNSKLEEISGRLNRQGFTQDHSGTIVVGGTAQEAVPFNPVRKYLFIQNLSSADLWFNFGGVNASPGQGSIRLLPNAVGVYESGFIPLDAVTIYGANAGQAFTIKQNFEG